MGHVTIQSVAKTALLPGIFPRLRSLFHNSFSSLAFLMASLYRSVNLLPKGHPYTLPSNFGRFGISDVVTAAAKNLIFSRKHMDQIFIFGVILLALLLLVSQAILFCSSLIFQTAWAQGSIQGLFSTPNPTNDIAYSMLDMVFGVPGIYGSSFDTVNVGGPAPFHAALHNMFGIYSFAMLLLGMIIFIYYFLQTAFETANTGQPFGSRFDTVWTPIRLIVALGLLVPFSFGLNSAQYIVLYAAKYGSSMATNMWLEFNNVLVANMGAGSASPIGYRPQPGEDIVLFKDTIANQAGNDVLLTLASDEQMYRRSLMAIPKTPGGRQLSDALILINACMNLYHKIDNPQLDTSNLGMWLVSSDTFIGLSQKKYAQLFYNIDSFPYEDALNLYEHGDIIIRYGIRDVNKYKDYAGNVLPLCGDLKIPINNLSSLNPADPTSGLSPGQIFQKELYTYVREFGYSPPNIVGFEINSALGAYWAERELDAHLQEDRQKTHVTACNDVSGAWNPFSLAFSVNAGKPCEESPLPDGNLFNFAGAVVSQDLADMVYLPMYEAAFGLSGPGIDVSISADVLSRGWGGAAIWYNRISEINGMLVNKASSTALPSFSRLPLVMEKVKEQKEKKETKIDYFDLYNPVIKTKQGTVNAFPGNEYDQRIATALFKMYRLTSERSRAGDEKTSNVNFFISMINFMLGTEGLYTMRENVQVHPLAQLTAIGRSMINAAISNLTIAVGTSTLGGFINVANKNLGAALTASAGFFSAFFSIGITAGIILHYIVPFFPFMFFFFAIISWVKTIFEAMVGVPLWALAHLRLEGQGLIGQAAANGYFLIFDIFIRPALILFGLIAASIIFFMEVYLLHITFDLVIENLAGRDPNCLNPSNPAAGNVPRGCDINVGTAQEYIDTVVRTARPSVDTFFFTILYTILVYIMANSTFKMIDAIPSGILRWIGGSTSTYSDNVQDPTENLTRNVSIGGTIIGQRLGQAIPDLGKSVGGGVGNFASKGMNILGRDRSGGGGAS